MRSFSPFTDWINEMGVTPAAQVGLMTYLESLLVANQGLNLVSRKLTWEQLVLDHLCDALVALPHIPKVEVIADLGSGGGFPAMPLAICLPKTQFNLFEKSPKKCAFLRSVAPDNIRVKGELGGNALDKGTGLVIARAFKPIGRILGLTRPYLAGGGRYLLFKGRAERISEELKASRALLGRRKVEVVPLSVPGQDKQRHLVCIG